MNNQIELFPEINHELIIPLNSLDDFQIGKKWENEPYKCRYLLAIFFRHYRLANVLQAKPKYKKLIYTYYDKLWFYIFDLFLVNIRASQYNVQVVINSLVEEFFAQKQIVSEKTNLVNQLPQKNLRYLPLQYFLEKSLKQLYPLERIVIMTQDNFQWEEEKILEYLNQQEQNITLSEVRAYYTQAHSRLINYLPTDIVTIYLS